MLRDGQIGRLWDALVVPGTLASYYFEGTGGFVLAQQCPYVIDPRTPLLQTSDLHRPPKPRASHIGLLARHDPDPELANSWPGSEIPISHWQADGKWDDVVDRVLTFQERYSTTAVGKIDKYATLLAEARREDPPESVEPRNPILYVPPYWGVTSKSDPWWELSRTAIQRAVDRFDDGAQLIPIIATTSSTAISAFAELIGELPEECRQVFCWRGRWVEKDATSGDVDDWVAVLVAAEERGIDVSNLYGGYLSVLMTALGLKGLNHGVGYSESRDVQRLGETGAPPVRYYIPTLHSFETVPNAQPVIDHLPTDHACQCVECQKVLVNGRPVVANLTPEQRKRHFLYVRENELASVRDDIRAEITMLRSTVAWIERRPFPAAMNATYHRRLRTWAESIAKHLTD